MWGRKFVVNIQLLYVFNFSRLTAYIGINKMPPGDFLSRTKRRVSCFQLIEIANHTGICKLKVAMNMRHITRFTYEFTNFQGWRVAISRQGVSLARYFSDKQYGDSEIALAQAINFRDMVLDELLQFPARTQEILMKHRAQPGKVYPAGLKPSVVTEQENDQVTPAFSMRSNKVLHNIMQGVCKRLKLDTASVLKLSLYLFSMQYGVDSAVAGVQENKAPMHADVDLTEEEQHAMLLQRIISELESRGRLVGLPDFEEFATGRSSRLVEPVPLSPVAEAMPDNYPAASRYMRSACPSPPAPVQTFRSPLLESLSSLSSINLPAHGSQAHSTEKREKSLPYSLTAVPARPIKLKRSAIRAGMPITPPDAM